MTVVIEYIYDLISTDLPPIVQCTVCKGVSKDTVQISWQVSDVCHDTSYVICSVFVMYTLHYVCVCVCVCMYYRLYVYVFV